MIKTVMPRVALIAFTLALAACATELRSVQLGETVAPEVIPGRVFAPSKSKANVGDVMLTAGEYSKEASSSRLEAFRVNKSTITLTKHKTNTFEFSIPAGDYRLRSRTQEGNYYSSPTSFSALNNDKRTGYGVY